MYLEIHVQPGPLSWSLAPTCTSIVSATFFEVWPQHVVGTRIVPAPFLQVWPQHVPRTISTIPAPFLEIWPQLVTYKHSPGSISWSLVPVPTCCTAYMKMHSGLTFRKNRKKSGPGPTILNFSRGPIISTRGAHNFYKGARPPGPPRWLRLWVICVQWHSQSEHSFIP